MVGVGDERLQESHQRAPFLHLAAKIVHGLLARPLRIGDRGAGLAKNIACDCAHGGPDRRAGLQGRFDAHLRF
jgi:hypothetical protein